MQNAQPQIPIIAVASGKGGVGKTTVAVNLSLALRDLGLRVGLIDADLYGPDVPQMMGLRRRADATSLTVFAVKGTRNSRLQAVECHGVQLASAGFLMGQDQVFGVGASFAQLLVSRLITDTTWTDPDCLVIDLPPGTADIQQSVFGLREKVLALLVVTPQVVAHQDARRLIADLGRRGTVAVGGIENMSSFMCPHCGREDALYPEASESESIWSLVDKLASIPFSPRAAFDADQGMPVMLTRAVPEQVTAYEKAAANILGLLSAEARSS